MNAVDRVAACCEDASASTLLLHAETALKSVVAQLKMGSPRSDFAPQHALAGSAGRVHHLRVIRIAPMFQPSRTHGASRTSGRTAPFFRPRSVSANMRFAEVAVVAAF